MAADQRLPQVGDERRHQQQRHCARQIRYQRQQGQANRRQAEADNALDRTGDQEGGEDH